MNGRPWAEADSALLGKMSDADVAEKTGHAKITVRVRRTLAGIKAFRGRRPHIIPLSFHLKSKYHSR